MNGISALKGGGFREIPPPSATWWEGPNLYKIKTHISRAGTMILGDDPSLQTCEK